MSRSLRVRVRAELDLDEIMNWIADRDGRAALRFQDRVRETIERIGRFPELSSELVTRKGRHFRITTVKRYRQFVIIYTLTDSAIEILRIVRGSRKLDNLLDE
jgi:plasmid stabilization system protein ParE